MKKYTTPDGYNIEIALLVLRENKIEMLLKQDKDNKWCLPGRFVKSEENAKIAAKSLLKEQLKVDDSFIRHVAIFDEPGRDYRGWIISNIFYMIVRMEDIKYQENLFFPIEQINDLEISYDHTEIINKVISNLKKDLLETTIAQYFLPTHFTIRELQDLLLLAKDTNEIRRTHFYTKIKNKGFIKPVLDENDQHLTTQKKNTKRPLKLYEFDEDDYVSSIYF